MKFRKIFYEGKTCNVESEDLDSVIRELRKKIKYLHGLKIDDIIEFLDKVGDFWSESQDFKKHFGKNLNHLVDFMKKYHLTIMLDTALRNRMALDGFVKLNKLSVFYHAQPRGLTVHWIAGNVPVLGIFSVLQSLLTKNVSLIKASSKSYQDMLKLLGSFKNVNTAKISGSNILKTIAVLLVDRKDRENHEKLSLAADIRVVWGGKEAVDTIINLKKRLETEDIIHGPKYSYAVIGKNTLDKDINKIAQKLAIDVCVFDQYACSSPHTVFVESGGRASPADFAKELAKQLSLVNRFIPKGKVDPGKSMDIVKIRTRYEFTGKVFSSENTDWTVVYSEEDGLAEPCFSRVVFVRPVSDINRIAELNDRGKQTMGLSMSLPRRMEFADKATLFGIDRCPSLGGMSFFESPWDGMFDLDRMVRWVTCYE